MIVCFKSMTDFEQLIVKIVEDHQGLKATELAVLVGDNKATVGLLGDFPLILDKLVSEGKLVELEYVLPSMNYRAKSFILPANTSCRLLGGYTVD